MKVDRYLTAACCKKTSVTLRLGNQVSKSIIDLFVNHGFTEIKQFTNSGMIYIESANLIATGVFGSDNLQIKCKVKDCEPFIDNFINLLSSL